MIVTIPRQYIRRLCDWSSTALITCAAGALGYCAFVLADMWTFQKDSSRKIDQLHVRLTPSSGSAINAMSGLVGRMEIPRLGISLAVAEGTGEATLRRAAGHIEGTELPGQPGNVGIAGHRDTLFRPLRNIRQDDAITLTTLNGEYRYRVVSTKIVSPSEVSVLNPDGDETLTLVTCYPFYFIGPAPKRFIVRAERVRNTDQWFPTAERVTSGL
jgi:sortase A